MKPSSRPLTGAAPDVLDWEQVDAHDKATGHDPLGLTPADRQILGLSPMKPLDLTLPPAGGAEAALAELMAEGVALGKRETKRSKSR